MNSKLFLKIVVDILIILTLLFVMGFQFWGDEAHEWLGLGIFLLLIVHQIFNRNWYKNLYKGKYSAFRICVSMINILLLMTIFLLAYSGIVMSRYIFDSFEISGSISLARRLHILGSYWGFLLMSAHLGLHWNMMIGIVKKKLHFVICSKVSFLCGFYIACYGLYVFFKRHFLTYMILKSEFVFMDYSEPKVLFYIDYLALMGLCIFILHFVGKFLKGTRNLQKWR